MHHLVMVCTDMANAQEARRKEQPKPPMWITRSNISREATAQRWRIREAEYLAQAEHCQSAEGIQGWRSLAGRCAETGPPTSKRRSRADARLAAVTGDRARFC